MITDFMKRPYVSFIFSLVCGLAYFGIVMNFITRISSNGSLLLAFFFFPAVVCGAAILVLKAIRMYIREERTGQLTFLFWSHILLTVISIFMVIDVFA